MNANIVIENRDLSLEDIISIWKSKKPINLADVLWQNVSESRAVLEKLLSTGGHSIYGINTGFGSLCNTVIPEFELDQLQYNWGRSHACGTGNYISKERGRGYARVWIQLGSEIQFSVPGSEFRVLASEFRVPCSGFRVPCSGFRFRNLNFELCNQCTVFYLQVKCSDEQVLISRYYQLR